MTAFLKKTPEIAMISKVISTDRRIRKGLSMKRPIIIGVAGGSGSGKTTVARNICERFSDSVALIEQDAYYKDQSHLPLEERIHTNYDHPFAFDTELLISHLQQLLKRIPIQKPVYDYTLHTRADRRIPVEPKDVIILEGILILEDERLRELMDIKVFVDTDADVRILRRLERDVKNRGRTLDSVIQQYLTVVRPMHLQFIEPGKRYADLIIPEGGYNQVAVGLLINQIQTILAES
ncbi:uridine kinase [Desmospora sp. 8437]|nr:uridine kinase [Desmospora sp. 8437]